jgi:hypothetical protein
MTTDEMEELTIGCCGVTVWLPKAFLKDKRDTKGTFYCPNGHPRVYQESTAEKLQRELDRKKADLNDSQGKLNRLKEGKCPFCWKTVKNLSSHLKTSH